MTRKRKRRNIDGRRRSSAFERLLADEALAAERKAERAARRKLRKKKRPKRMPPRTWKKRGVDEGWLDPSTDRISYNAYIRSQTWKINRRPALERANGHCEECGRAANLEVHHLTYSCLGRESASELKAICRDCHSIEHEGKHGAWDSMSVEFRAMI